MKYFKYKISNTLILLITSMVLNAQSIETILHVPFDTIGGVETSTDNISVEGLIAYAMMDDNRVALLCNVEGKVKIYDIETEKMRSEFAYDTYASFIKYDPKDAIFYIGGQDEINLYCIDGTKKQSILFNSRDYILHDIVTNDNGVFIQEGRGNHIPIVLDNVVQSIENQKGKVRPGLIMDGEMSTIQLVEYNKDHASKYLVNKGGVSKYYTIGFGNDSSIGVVPLGIINNILILKENSGHNYIYNSLIFYDLIKYKKVDQIDIPAIHYTYQNNTIQIFDNAIYNLLNTPEGAYLFKIDLSSPTLKSASIKGNQYPSEFNYKYFYNDHLKKKANSDFEIQLKSSSTETPDIGMRSEVLNRAFKYANIRWNATSRNIPENDFGIADFDPSTDFDISNDIDYIGNKSYWVNFPDYISTEKINIGMAYKWGGFTHYNQWDYYVNQGKITGDITSGYFERGNTNVIGIDCSSFIARAYDYSTWYTTGSLPFTDNTLSSWNEVKKGDFLNNEGSHVVLFLEYLPTNGKVRSLESFGFQTSHPKYGKTECVGTQTLELSRYASYKKHPLPMIDDDYDLVITSSSISPSILGGNISGSINIKNIGTASCKSKTIRLAIYELPANGAVAEVGDLVDDIEIDYLSLARNNTKTLNLSNVYLYANTGLYIMRLEYLRDKGSYDDKWQEIPYQNYESSPDNIVAINGYRIKGMVSEDVNIEGPISFTLSQYTGIINKSTLIDSSQIMVRSTTNYQGISNTAGDFYAVAPSSWNAATIDFSESTLKDITFELSNDTYLFAERSTSSGGSGGYITHGGTRELNLYEINNYHGLTLDTINTGIPVLSLGTGRGYLTPKAIKDYKFITSTQYPNSGKKQTYNVKRGIRIVSSFYKGDAGFWCIRDKKDCFIRDLQVTFEKLDNDLKPISSKSVEIVPFPDYCECGHSFNTVGYDPTIEELAEKLSYTLDEGVFYRLTLGDDFEKNNRYSTSNSHGYVESSTYFYVLPSGTDIIVNNEQLVNQDYYVANNLTVSNTNITNSNVIAGNKIVINSGTRIKENSNLIIKKRSYENFGINHINLKGSTVSPKSIENEYMLPDVFIDPCPCLCSIEEAIQSDSTELTLDLIETKIDFTSNIKIFPNPAESTVNIEYSKMLSDVKEIAIVNLLGQVILIKTPTSSTSVFDLSGNPPGVYTIRLDFKDLTYQAYKLIVQ